MKNSALLAQFVAAYPAQPATAYWRAIEIGAVIRLGLPQGFGLDLGCGDGLLTDILLSHLGPRRLVGIDPDPAEIEAARRFAFYERLHCATGDAIPEKNGTFDFVLSNSVLEHVPAMTQTLAETARVLKPGGRFVFTVPGPMFRAHLRGPLAPGVDRAAYLEKLDRRIAHFNYLDPAQWTQALGLHGLHMEKSLGYLDATETRRWETLSRVTGGLLYALFGETKRPIEIQRALGARALQNSMKLPKGVSAAIGRGLSLGASVDRNADHWLSSELASCLLLTGRKA